MREYHVSPPIEFAYLQKELNAGASQGWDLVTVVTNSDGQFIAIWDRSTAASANAPELA